MIIDDEDDSLAETSAANEGHAIKRRQPAVKGSLKKAKKDGAPSGAMAAPLNDVVVKKLAAKKGKPVSKFSRKKYCCPFCSRRFLTRGNVKNHMRIHSREKAYQCKICRV